MRIKSIALFLLLQACAPHKVSDAELSARSDQELCEQIQAEPDNKKIEMFVKGRGLSCHPWQQSCMAAGFKQGTPQFTGCLDGMATQYRIETEKDAMKQKALSEALQKTFPKPATTNCYGGYGHLSCTTQ